MAIYKNGKRIAMPQHFKNEYQREKFLSGVHEVHEFLPPKVGRMFKLSERAKMRA